MEVQTLPAAIDGTWAACLPAPALKSNIAVSVADWPTKLDADLAWDASTFGSEEAYTLLLTKEDVLEIRAAVKHFNSLGLYGSEVSASNFPLPELGPKLKRLGLDVHRGRGFAGIRGLKPGDFSPEDNVVVFLGVSSYIGAQRGRQDENGNMLTHIRDAKKSRAPQGDRPTRYSAQASTFHTDAFCDILALQTRSNAAFGGRNILASSWTVYNKLAATRPDVIELLARPIWPFDSRSKLFEANTRPLLFYHGGKVLLNFSREPLIGLQGVRRKAGLATLTPQQREALDLVEQIAVESQIVLEAKAGDMLFVNNHAVLHSREAFSDRVYASRYLVRLWLRNAQLAWKLPRQLQVGNDRIYGDIGVEERWNVVDEPRIDFQLSERLTS
jgi:hypothetical protein